MAEKPLLNRLAGTGGSWLVTHAIGSAVEAEVDGDTVAITSKSELQNGAANPGNPYAEVDQPQRDQAFRELARTVLLRTVSDAAASN